MAGTPVGSEMTHNGLQALPISHQALSGGDSVARFLAAKFIAGQSAVLLRYGDTGGRIMARPPPGTREYAYLQDFLGASVTSDQVAWMAMKIEESVSVADVIGLRSDLLGPIDIPDDFFSGADDSLRSRLVELYPIRPIEQKTLSPDGARRLGETRRAMQNMRLPRNALLTDAWVHVTLAENGFLSALLRQASGVAICTSSLQRTVVREVNAALEGRLRLFECPAHPTAERQWGGDHSFLWNRWQALTDAMIPAYPGEPLLISAGIWTKIIAPEWATNGGIAIDMGSVMDYFALSPSRPAVLATRYNDPRNVPNHFSIENQLKRHERIEDFLVIAEN